MAEIKTNILPNFLVIGAAKCGTTSIYHYLKQHRDVYMSPIKEPNHFSKDIHPEEFSPEYKIHEKAKNLDVYKYVRGDMKEDQWGAYVQSEEDYKLLFKFAGGKKRIGEISNSYLYSEVAAKNIKSTLPGVKLIAILRNPADRAYSHYLANIRDGRAILPFRKELEADMAKPQKGWGKSHLYLELGMYSDQIKRYKALFTPDQLKILVFDDLKANTPKVVKDVFEFLDLDPEININFGEKHNEAKVPKNVKFLHLLTQTGLKRKVFRALPKSMQNSVKSLFFKSEGPEKMSTEDRKWLNDLFKTEVEALGKELNRDLSHWLKA
jgi:hypothetical protein